MSRYVEAQKSDKFDDEYFASKEVTECVSDVIEKIDEYFSEMNRTGRINLYRNAYFKFYAGFILKGALYNSGQMGELVNTYVNHYANLITHMVNMVCQQKLAYEPQVIEDDSEAQDQIKLAKGILFAYANNPEADLDGILRNATEMSCVFMESYVSVLWNKSKGRTLAVDIIRDQDGSDREGNELKEGDNEYQVHSPFDVIVDTSLTSNASKKWVVLRKWENKFDVAAEYPNWADEIVQLSAGANLGDTQLTYSISGESDIIPIHYFFHDKTSAVRGGRFIKFIDDTIILSDGKLEYREIPLKRIATRELWGSPYGYSRSADLLPLQETVDRLCSAIVTNELTFATQNILIAKGSQIEWENLYGGLNVIEWDASLGEAGKPAALQLTSTPPEVFNFVKQTVTDMGVLAGINDAIKDPTDLVVKGQASGAALAMMSSASIQFNSDLQKAYIRLAEQVGTATIHNLQDFAFPDLGNGQTLSREGMSASHTNKYFKTKYSKPDLDKVDKIVVRYGNALSQTTAGRMQLAETFMMNKMVNTPQQYIEVMETGSLQPILESEESQLHLIKEEDEALVKGEVPPVLWSDNHVLHIPEHLAGLANLDARKDMARINATRAHVDMHVNALKTLDPILAGLMKQPVLNAPPQMPQPGQPPALPQNPENPPNA